MKTDVLDYSLDGKSYLGYAAIPEADTFPAVIIAHTWVGRDAFV